jgi:hypothetical protein
MGVHGMEAELIRYYEDRLSMMGDPAWKDLCEDVEVMMKAANDISAIQDEKTLHFKRGEISMMRWILGLKEVSEQAYQQLREDDEKTA